MGLEKTNLKEEIVEVAEDNLGMVSLNPTCAVIKRLAKHYAS